MNKKLQQEYTGHLIPVSQAVWPNGLYGLLCTNMESLTDFDDSTYLIFAFNVSPEMLIPVWTFEYFCGASYIPSIDFDNPTYLIFDFSRTYRTWYQPSQECKPRVDS